MSLMGMLDNQIAQLQARVGAAPPAGQDQPADAPAALPEAAQPPAMEEPIPEATEPAGEQLAASDADENPFSPKARLSAARTALANTRQA
jgi:hypothetical protein